MADLLERRLEAKQFDWQPPSARDYAGRARSIREAIGSVRLVDLDPFRLAWVADNAKSRRRRGAIRSRVATLPSDQRGMWTDPIYI